MAIGAVGSYARTPVLGALLLAGLAFALLQTMVVPAIPHFAEEYGTSTSIATWVLIGQLLSAAVCTPLAGRLGDLFGRGRVLTIVLLLFCLGAVLSALAPTIEVLILGRLISGVGGGIFPLAFGIINDEIATDRRAASVGIMSAIFGIGGGIGLPLSGVIIDNTHVSVLFWVGMLALPAAIAVWRYVPQPASRTHAAVDWRGAAVFSAGLAAVLLAASMSNSWGWDSAAFLGVFSAGLALLAVFVVLQLRTPVPLVDVRVMRSRPVLAANATGLFSGVTMFAWFILVPQFAQAPAETGFGFGMTTTEAGLLMLPASVTMLVAGAVGGVLGTRVGFRTTLAVGTLLIGVSFAVLVGAHSSPREFVISGVLMGAGIAFALAAMINVIIESVDPGEVSVATGINTVMRIIGGALGSACIAAVLAAETLPDGVVPTEGAFTEAFVISGACAVLAMIASLMIPRGPARVGPVPAEQCAQPTVAAARCSTTI